MSFAFIVMIVLVASFLILAGGLLSIIEAPFMIGIPFGIGEWLVGNTPSIISVSLFIFLTSLMLIRGGTNWVQMLGIAVISIAVFFMSGGMLW